MINLDEINEYSEDMQIIQGNIFEYIENYHDEKINFQELADLPKNINIFENKTKTKTFLHLISKISENHRRNSFLLSKIERILLHLKEEILNNFYNDEIFTIFQKNKRILLFLFHERIINPTKFIASVIISDEYKNKYYPNYFFDEFSTFFNESLQKEIKKSFNETDLQDNFEKKRKLGENDSYICELIRNDDINEFITYVNYENIPLSTEITPSIFETNSLLLKRKASLIEYSAFFGSMKIFKYLLISKADYTSSLWLYAIHSNNPELIHILEDNEICPEYDDYYICYKESIKCFNSEFANYFENNYLNESFEKTHLIKYFNFTYFPKLVSLFDLCKYDHIIPVQIILENIGFDLNNQNENALLIIAAEKGNVEIVQLLLKCKGININEKKIFDIEKNTKKEETTALIAAIKNNYFDIVKLILQEKKVDVNSKLIIKKHRHRLKQIERTALFLAVSNENTEIVNLLLNKDTIDPNLKSFLVYPRRYEEKTPLIKAIEIGNVEIVRLLLNNQDIDVNHKLVEDKTYLHTKYTKSTLYLAVEKGNIEIIQLLLNCTDIDVNEISIIAINNKKLIDTPLCFSIENNNTDIVKLLLSHQYIDINKKSKSTEKNNNGEKIKIMKSPLQIAIENENMTIINMLLNCSSINMNDSNYICIEKKSNERFFIFVILIIIIIIIFVHSSNNENIFLYYFCQLGLMILAIISFYKFNPINNQIF